MWNNLSKTFRYVNDLGGEIILDYEHGFLCNKPQGIDTLSVQLTQSQGIDQTGSTIQSRTIQPRPVVFTGRLCGEYQDRAKEQLLSVVRPDVGGTLYADDYFLKVIPTASPEIQASDRFAEFVFSVLAAYPYWQAQAKKEEVLSGLKYKFKFPCNFSKPYRFAEPVDQVLFVLKNQGQTAVPFRVTITTLKSASNFKLTNAKTGQILFLKKEFQTGERVVINITHDKIEALSSMDGDITGALTLDSNFFALQTGDNVVKPEFDSGKEFAKVSVTYAEEKVGITL